MQTIKNYLDNAGFHYVLAEVQGEWRVYDRTRNYYVSVKAVSPDLPYLVSLVRLKHQLSQYELFSAVKSAMDNHHLLGTRELDLCG